MQTVGVSPKLWAAIAAALLSHLLVQELVDLPSWADLLIQLGAVGLSTYMAPPGAVTSRRFDDVPDFRDEAFRDETGQSLIEVGTFLLLIAVAVVLLVKFA